MSLKRYATNPFFLCQSLPPSNPRTTGHQNGGILILCHPSLVTSISSSSITEYCCSFKIHETKISAVYFPPTLSDDAIRQELQTIDCTDILLGDINVRLGSLSGDSISTSSSRRKTIYSWTSSQHLSYVKNSNQAISRTDHIFSKLPLSWTYNWNLAFKSDHGLMDITLPVERVDKPMTPTTRYNFRPLLNPFFSLHFANYYDHYHGPIVLAEANSAIDQCLYSMILPSSSETQNLLDVTYDALIDSIRNTMASNLTTYDARLVKANRDNTVHLTADSSNLSTIRAFKRSQRSKHANNPIKSRDPELSPIEDCRRHYEALLSSDEHAPVIQRTNDVVFSLKFTESTVTDCIRKYPSCKSMGIDGIHALVLKSLCCSPLFVRILSTIYQISAATGLVPSQWSECRLHLLQKDPLNPIASKTRPIVLSSLLRRIFEKLLLRTWLANPLSWMTLHPSQAGFRRGYNTHSQLLLSDEISRHDNPLSIFLDLTSAFDNISWKKLTELLNQLHCPANHLSMIQSLICKPATLELSVNNSERILLHTHKGVFQGGGISAFIFAVYINPLAIILNTNAPIHRPLGLLFADDVQLKPRTSTEAQYLLDLCTDYAYEFRMKWNIAKCAVLGSSLTFYLSQIAIPLAQTYKYLGMIHTSKGVDWLSTLKVASFKQNQLLNAISDNSWHPKARLTIFKTFVRPITDYCHALAVIWADRLPKFRQEVFKLINDNHRNGVKFVFGTKSCSKVLDFVSGLGPSSHYSENLRCGLARFLKQLDPSNPLAAAKTTYLLSSSKNFVIPFCYQSSYLKEFTIEKNRSPKGILYRTWLSRKLRDLLLTASSSSRLHTYILPLRSLPNNSSPILLQNPETIRKGLAWRTNVSFIGKLCQCGKSFNRSHLPCIFSCNVLFRSVLSCDHFRDIQEEIPQYSVLDHLLNNSEYQEFNILYDHLHQFFESS